MRIRMWNAFASNNSGSYSIVESFPSVERAEQVAAELLPVIRAHSDWMNTRPGWDESERADSPSPLEQWAVEHDLQWSSATFKKVGDRADTSGIGSARWAT